MTHDFRDRLAEEYANKDYPEKPSFGEAIIWLHRRNGFTAGFSACDEHVALPLRKENEALREALNYYATLDYHPANFEFSDGDVQDFGTKAREALSAIEKAGL